VQKVEGKMAGLLRLSFFKISGLFSVNRISGRVRELLINSEKASTIPVFRKYRDSYAYDFQ